MTKRFIAAALTACALTGAAHAQTKHALLIGIDGLGYGTKGLSAVSTPNIDSLINGTWQAGYNGAYANNAFTGGGSIFGAATLQPTVSGPGWSTIHTGVWTDQHGVTSNSFGATNNYEDNKSYLEILEENVAGIQTGSAVYWTPIDTYIIDSIDDADSSIDYRANTGGDGSVASLLSTFIAGIDTNNPSASFASFLEVDIAGHRGGSGGDNYANAIMTADTRVGQLLAAVSGRASFANEDWQIIVVSDHGHLDEGGHGGQSEIERTVPLIIASSSVTQGNLSGADQLVSIADVAPTALDHFDLAIPDNIVGVSRAVPEPGSLSLLGLGGLCLLRRRRRA